MATKLLVTVFAALFAISLVAAGEDSPTLLSGYTSVVRVGDYVTNTFCSDEVNSYARYHLNIKVDNIKRESAKCMCECYKQGYERYSLQYYKPMAVPNRSYPLVSETNLCTCGGGPLTKPVRPN